MCSIPGDLAVCLSHTHIHKQERSRSTWHIPGIIIAAGESTHRPLPSPPSSAISLWTRLLQLQVILLSFQIDIYQCKTVTQRSYPRVKLDKAEGRNQKGCCSKQRATNTPHPIPGYLSVPSQPGSLFRPPFQNFLVNIGAKSNLWGCPMWSSRKAFLNHAGKQEAHASSWSF